MSPHRVGLAALLAGVAAAQSPAPLFVELVGVPAQCYVQEPCEVVVRVGFDAAWFATAAVPLLAQPLDQPFHVVVPWLGDDDQRSAREGPLAADATVARIAVGDRVLPWRAAGSRTVAQRSFTLLELPVRVLPLQAGELALAPVRVRYAFATRFQEDFLRGRQAVDRQEATVAAGAAAIAVRALPATAPPGFTGAVGSFTVRADSQAKAVAVGQSFVVAVAVQGRGNLERFAAPAAPRLPGFHVQGVAERRAPEARIFELDVLALREGVAAVPPIAWVAFDPARGAYTTLTTAPVPIAVGPAAGELPPRVRELVAADAQLVASERAPSRWWALAAAAAVALATSLLRLRRRSTRRTQAVARAAAALAAVPLADAEARLRAFEALLCAAIAAPRWSAGGFDELARRGVDDGLRTRLRELHAAFDAARFGGAAPTAGACAAAADALIARCGA